MSLEPSLKFNLKSVSLQRKCYVNTSLKVLHLGDEYRLKFSYGIVCIEDVGIIWNKAYLD